MLLHVSCAYSFLWDSDRILPASFQKSFSCQSGQPLILALLLACACRGRPCHVLSHHDKPWRRAPKIGDSQVVVIELTCLMKKEEKKEHPSSLYTCSLNLVPPPSVHGYGEACVRVHSPSTLHPGLSALSLFPIYLAR